MIEENAQNPKLNSSRRELLRNTGKIGTFLVAASVLPGKAVASGSGFPLPATTPDVAPFQLKVPQEALDDLRRRLEATRWPEHETVLDLSQGAPLKDMQRLTTYWRTSYDWRRFEAKINAFGQYRTEIDGLGIHFLHIRSKHSDALPLLLTHGWPGSIIEFLKVIDPLTNPTEHGGQAEDAFDLVIPSLPGFGLSDRPSEAGWDVVRTARAWITLMDRLGYRRWVAQGGDWGAGVTTVLGHMEPPGLAGIHLNWPLVFPKDIPTTGLSFEEQRAVTAANEFLTHGYGYFLEQMTRPQTVGYGLADSPAGQAAWIFEKFQAWTDNDGNVETILSLDEMLDDITLYWLTNTGASSGRIYWQNQPESFSGGLIKIPVAVSVFPKEIYRAPRSWVEASYPKLIYWNEVAKGGHFAAFEQPSLFVSELRSAFRSLRSA